MTEILAADAVSTGTDGWKRKSRNRRKARNEQKAQMPDNEIVGNGGWVVDTISSEYYQ